MKADIPIPEIPKRYWEDREWISNNLPKISANHQDEWVAIYNKEVIASNKELGKTEDAAKKIVKDEPVVLIYIGSGHRVF